MDWSSNSLMDRVLWVQSMVGFISFSHGSPRMTFSFPRVMTWKVTFCGIPSILRERVEVKWMTPLLLMELSVFLA